MAGNVNVKHPAKIQFIYKICNFLNITYFFIHFLKMIFFLNNLEI
jgi:hypothetical protein